MTVPVGAQLTRIYYAVQTNHYTIGDAYDTWDEAVAAAQAAYEKRVTSLAASASWSTPASEIQATAKNGVTLCTRWVMAWDRDADGIGGSMDFMHERHADVTVLRTRESFAPKLARLPSADQVLNLTARGAAELARSMNEQ